VEIYPTMAKPPHILVVDDERSIRMMLEAGLTLNGFTVTTARTGKEALSALQTAAFDVVVSDIYMPDGDGLEVVRELRSLNSSVPIILITAQGSVELAVRAVEEGATDFIAKPFEVAAIAALLRRHLQARREAGEDTGPKAEGLADDLSHSGLVGRSPAMVVVYKLIAQAARTDAPVLIMGESGTGKELVARAIHDFSVRRQRPFVAVNCSGLTDTLLEAELFGHARGAYTGAVGERGGFFEAADGGTLFLDELGSTSPAFQASLLRVLQSGEVRRLGSTQARRVNVRILGASNASLRQLAAEGGFRADLFYRLSVLTIELAPLRERQSDVELLATHFLQKTAGENRAPLRMTHEVMDALRNYPFPGNVRELENAVRRAVALCSGDVITLDCLPAEIASAASVTRQPTLSEAERALVIDRPTMDELQRRYLQFVLDENGGNRRRAATVLGLDRRTVQRLISRYQLRAQADLDAAADAGAEVMDASENLKPETDC
jgi:DNA-binding NtrC family response regulator